MFYDVKGLVFNWVRLVQMGKRTVERTQEPYSGTVPRNHTQEPYSGMVPEPRTKNGTRTKDQERCSVPNGI